MSASLHKPRLLLVGMLVGIAGCVPASEEQADQASRGGDPSSPAACADRGGTCTTTTCGSEPCASSDEAVAPPPEPSPPPPSTGACATWPSAGASSSLVARVVATRTSGTAPLAVLFDATTSTTSVAGRDPFREVTYGFDFCDERGETWAISGLPKSRQTGGPVAAHVFDVPGTYTVRVRASDDSGHADAFVTITVADPSTTFAAAGTVCVSTSSNFSGCPGGAAHLTALPSAFAYSDKRVLLRRGESFGAVGVGHVHRNVVVGAFGIGAKPEVSTVEIGTGRVASAQFNDDVTIMDLAVMNGIVQHNSASRILLYRNDLTQPGAGRENQIVIGAALEYWAENDPWRNVPTSAFFYPREIFVVENQLRGANPTNLGLFYGTMSRLALLGNDMVYAQQHTARIFGLHKGVIAHNALRGRSSDGIRHALKLHSGGLGTYADGYQAASPGWATRQVVIANNLFGDPEDNNAWTVAIAPENGTSAQGIEDVVVENNRFVRGASTVTDLILTGRRLTSRGNVRADGGPIGIGLDGHGGALPAAWKGPYSTN